jgi:hypothetical protein
MPRFLPFAAITLLTFFLARSSKRDWTSGTKPR